MWYGVGPIRWVKVETPQQGAKVVTNKKSAVPSLIKCDGTLFGIFATKNGKKMQHFKPGNKPHILLQSKYC
jgi:hypothetical protein